MEIEFTPQGVFAGLLAQVIVYGLGGLVLGGHLVFVVHRWLTHRRAEILARAAESSLPPLKGGPIALHGAVETDDDTPAFTLTIQEMGREWLQKEVWHHEWKESTRWLVTRPFTLRLSSGQGVRVIPDAKVIYIDTLEARLLDHLHHARQGRPAHAPRGPGPLQGRGRQDVGGLRRDPRERPPRGDLRQHEDAAFSGLTEEPRRAQRRDPAAAAALPGVRGGRGLGGCPARVLAAARPREALVRAVTHRGAGQGHACPEHPLLAVKKERRLERNRVHRAKGE
ncbi:Hypothetical protein CAP_2329 [Chondromyces apiculatus DSM 436]|uniref:Uncharacterized protein n=1 Tax=Chondromyces apiculatus DSM 436 TaxID=1192034 RepID=A0A017TA93_9BACT|nr:Hypothetical protein CAP_2329 [Chondromyces apiculatus DSM 436]